MSKPEYDQLISEVSDIIANAAINRNMDVDAQACAILALIREHLREPSDAMVKAWNDADPTCELDTTTDQINRMCAKADLNAMINASDLTPGDKRVGE